MGQKQQVWVQSQTTFACVAKNEEGQHMCKVLKQKIWVEGISYELQEIYGMEHASDGLSRHRYDAVFCVCICRQDLMVTTSQYQWHRDQ